MLKIFPRYFSQTFSQFLGVFFRFFQKIMAKNDIQSSIKPIFAKTENVLKTKSKSFQELKSCRFSLF